MDLEKAYNKIDNLCCIHSIREGYFDAYKETQDDDFCKDIPEMIEALETIKTVVDLQKELGCPLKVIFKALRDGIYIYDKWNYGEQMLHYIPVLKNGEFVCGFGNKEYYIRMLSDYKKTWWLRPDRSE